MKRSPLKRYTPLASRGARMKCTRLASRSPSKKADDAKYRQAKKEHFAQYPGCQWKGCQRSLLKGDLIDIHHKAGRNGPLLYTREYFASLCREHHNFVEEHLSWSRANGWIIDLTTEEVRALR